MRKTIFSAGQERLQRILREMRESAGITQIEFAKKLKVPQSFVSRLRAGRGVLILVELQAIFKAANVSLVDFVKRFEAGEK